MEDNTVWAVIIASFATVLIVITSAVFGYSVHDRNVDHMTDSKIIEYNQKVVERTDLSGYEIRDLLRRVSDEQYYRRD